MTLFWRSVALFAFCSTVARTEEDINDILAKMKGMPGMENLKVFGKDDIDRMTKTGDFSGFGGSSPPLAYDCEKELTTFYTKYGMEDKLDGIEAACKKWKGKEYKMMVALRKKYKDVIAAHDAEL
eukprot:TRINITY_DN41535_c0_g1_i1.p1 TRINITY_DN41535_c0_g1~~TRINITY_DN41535_c0_g1_i1.p1  ORF type:complete len:125 (-),score=31.50 TRINITY_DN41535_c0_g1_i1:190-564(-)